MTYQELRAIGCYGEKSWETVKLGDNWTEYCTVDGTHDIGKTPKFSKIPRI
jgi:hypothetical protein